MREEKEGGIRGRTKRRGQRCGGRSFIFFTKNKIDSDYSFG